MKIFVLLVTSIIPGFATIIASGYFLLIEWTVLTQAHNNFEQISKQSFPSIEEIVIAQAAENRHRLNCFAEGVGVLLGGIWLSIGVHGVCTVFNGNKSN